jgi:excisionase family DNA binding protein
MRESRKFLSVAEAARQSSLSARLLYTKIQNRELRHFKVGKRIVIDEEDLLDFITREPVEAVDWNEKAMELK